jgi:hypothetical protein
MTQIHRLTTLATIAVLAMAMLAGPASAKSPHGDFTYFAQIDCGQGTVEVGSGDDLWSPLVDLDSGKKYKPIAWHVSGDGFAVDEVKSEAKKHAVVCSYSDGEATGTVTVKKA